MRRTKKVLMMALALAAGACVSPASDARATCVQRRDVRAAAARFVKQEEVVAFARAGRVLRSQAKHADAGEALAALGLPRCANLLDELPSITEYRRN